MQQPDFALVAAVGCRVLDSDLELKPFTGKANCQDQSPGWILILENFLKPEQENVKQHQFSVNPK